MYTLILNIDRLVCDGMNEVMTEERNLMLLFLHTAADDEAGLG